MRTVYEEVAGVSDLRRVVNYRVVRSLCQSELGQGVQEWINEGYEPSGNAFVASDRISTIQPMIRRLGNMPLDEAIESGLWTPVNADLKVPPQPPENENR